MESGDRERAHVYVSGQVQGVFFRDSTQEIAEQLGLTGWVKNLPDGRVEALFEGPSERVREMIRWCEQGPPHAKVDTWTPSSRHPREFSRASRCGEFRF
jgi:acylphosphatase